MKTFKIAILASSTAALTVLSACSTVKVTTDYDHSAPFGSYRTYALEPPTNVPPLSPTADSALRSALRENLAARGIREVSPGEKPDLAVVPHTRLEQKYSTQQYTQWGYGPGVWPYYGGYYGMWGGAPYTYNTITSYTEGTLILDFVDTSKQKLVFRGIGTATVDSAKSNAKKIRKAVEKIVAKLPAPPPPSPSAKTRPAVDERGWRGKLLEVGEAPERIGQKVGAPDLLPVKRPSRACQAVECEWTITNKAGSWAGWPAWRPG